MRSRVRYMVLGWGSVGLVYLLTALFEWEGFLLSPTWVDHAIPFTPHAVWPYLSFFLIIPCAYLFCPFHRLRWLSLSMVFIAVAAGICYLVFPTTMEYPVDLGQSWSSYLLERLMKTDTPRNCFPSLHAALTVLSVWAMLDKKYPYRSFVFIVWGLLVCLSIIQLRRHLFPDLVSGTLLALGVGYVCKKINKPQTECQS